MHATRILASLALVLAVTACGGDDDAPETGATEPAADTPSGDTPSAAAITISNFTFEGVTEIAVGTTVVVTNTDNTQHTWTALDGAFDSSALGEGDTFEFTFAEPGEFEYQCNFHPSMTGTIIVTGS